MKKSLSYLCATLSCLLMAAPSMSMASTTTASTDSHLAAPTAVVIKHIRIIGLQRVTASTASSYVPVHVGQRLTSQASIDIIQSLYHTGFFSDVRVDRQGSTLIIYVTERPTIGYIHFSGNKAITNKELLKALNSTHISDGQVYNSADIQMITEGLKQQYASMGRQNVLINVKTQKLNRNRVGISISINEGGVANVESIHIVGNHAFSEHTLLDQFKLTTPGIFSFFTHDDRYTVTKLAADLQSLSNFYLDHGYLHFDVVSQKVQMTKNKEKVNITIRISEGSKYTLSGYTLDNQSNAPTADLVKLVTLKAGSTFSRAKVMAVNDKLAGYFANNGYAFPSILALPKIDNANDSVFLTYQIKPGRRVYVRYINFSGNDRTAETVLRRQMVQMEGSIYSASKIKESKRRLANLSYLQNIQVHPTHVVGDPNQVDLNYHADEINAGRASIMGGYSDTDGFIYGANLSEPNFMGTGKSVSIGLTRSGYSDNYNFSYFNPFYTINNVGRGFSLYYQHAKPSSSVNRASYIMNGFGGTVTYSIPVSEYSNLSFGGGYDNISIQSSSDTPPEIVNFLNRYGTKYNEFKFLAGWSYSNLNQVVFPTSGFSNSLNMEAGLPVMSSSLGYYKFSYFGSWYHPLNAASTWLLNLHSNLGYGNGYGKTKDLPFFDNFYGGGIDTIPGFTSNTLGPKDKYGNGLGGNLQLVAGVDLIFPNPVSKSLRTALTFNAGNIYNTSRAMVTGSSSQDSSGPLRYSLGVKITWYSPFGPLQFSLAKVINKQPGDQLSPFNFSFGASI